MPSVKYDARQPEWVTTPCAMTGRIIAPRPAPTMTNASAVPKPAFEPRRNRSCIRQVRGAVADHADDEARQVELPNSRAQQRERCDAATEHRHAGKNDATRAEAVDQTTDQRRRRIRRSWRRLQNRRETASRFQPNCAPSGFTKTVNV